MTGNNGLPQGWITAPLNTIGDFLTGVTYKKADASKEPREGYLPVLRANNINGKLNFDDLVYVPKEKVKQEQIIQKNDIVICMSSGSKHLVGKAAQAETEFEGGFGAFCGLFRCYEGVEPKFVGYFFQSDQYRHTVSGVSKGININNLRRDHIESMEITLPPRPEQDRIVAKLEETFTQLEAGVTELQNAKAQLKRYRAAVLKSAVEGDLTREWREAHQGEIEPAKKLLARILDERRKKWEAEGGKGKYKEPAAPDTESLPGLPEGWVWGTLDQCFTVERGRFSIRPRNDPRYYDGPYPFVQIGDLPREGGNITSYSKTLNEAGLKVSRYFQKGTVLIAIVGATIANTGVLTFESCSPDSLVAIQSDDEIRQRFVEIYLRYNKLKIRGEAYASGGQPNINLRVLLPYPIPVPSREEQQRIVEMVERRLSVADEIEKELDESLVRAERLRGSILKNAFEGKF